MYYAKSLAALAFVGAAAALPAPEIVEEVVWTTVWETVYATGPYNAAQTAKHSHHSHHGHHSAGVAPSPQPSAAASSVNTPKPAPPAPTSTQVVQVTPSAAPPAPSKVSSAAPAPAASSAAAPAAPAASSGYMAIVAEWRSKMGLKALKQSSLLEANALKTAKDDNGVMKHELNPGSFAQVLAPGQPSDFEHCFVGGWLCERPTIPGLDGICTTESVGWEYTDGTGHADILTSPSYSQIGCANAVGIWACDLA